MASATLPFPGVQPGLKEKEPVDGPGNDRVCDVFLRRPIPLFRIVQAEERVIWIMLVEVDMRHQFPCTTRVGSNNWINHLDSRIWVFQPPRLEKTPLEVDHADVVAPHDRRQRPLPDGDPAGIRYQFELRELSTNVAVLLPDAWPAHYSVSPKNLCSRVLRAAAGVVPSITPAAGTCPLPGRWAPLPWPCRCP